VRLAGRRRAAAVGLAGALLGEASLAAAGALRLEVSGPAFEGSALAVEIERTGQLANRKIVAYLAVDGVAVDRYPLDQPRTRVELRSPALTAGRHEILVKSGSERAAVTIRVWPRWVPGAAIGAGVAALLAVAWGIRRRRTRR
jgi:hypothetical protein